MEGSNIMKRTIALFGLSFSLSLFLAVSLIARPAQAPVAKEAYERGPGPYEVATVSYDWVDSARGNRKVPVKIYYPQKGQGPFRSSSSPTALAARGRATNFSAATGRAMATSRSISSIWAATTRSGRRASTPRWPWGAPPPILRMPSPGPRT